VHHLLIATADTLKAGTGPSKVPFYVAGGLLFVWAIAVALFGISRNRADWPASEGAARGVMLVSVVLVVAAMATAVISD
jgi:hypothetical protein